jgi:hypothetical protein
MSNDTKIIISLLSIVLVVALAGSIATVVVQKTGGGVVVTQTASPVVSPAQNTSPAGLTVSPAGVTVNAPAGETGATGATGASGDSLGAFTSYEPTYTKISGNVAVGGSFYTGYSYDDGEAGAGAAFTMATGTTKWIWTNANTDKADALCRGASSAIYATSTPGFAPAIVFSLGTSTSATGYATNLLASTTVASSTVGRVIPLTYTSDFVVRYNESIVGALSDANGGVSSSTAYTATTIRPQISCSLMGK